MKLLSKLFGKKSDSDNLKVEPAAEPVVEPAVESVAESEHFINIKGCMVPTHFESKELCFDKYEFQKSSDRCRNAPTGYGKIYSNYLEWRNKCELSSDQQNNETDMFFQRMKREIYRCIAVPGELSDEEICFLACWIAEYSCNSHGLSGYCSGKVYIEILTTECMNCLLFAMIFGEQKDYAFLIDPAFVKENDWLQKYEIPFSLLEKLSIFVLLDKDVLAIPRKQREDEYCNFGLWDAVNDRCFAAIRQRTIHEETEDGYPIDVIGYRERFEPVGKTPKITDRLNKCIQASEQTKRGAFESHYVC